MKTPPPALTKVKSLKNSIEKVIIVSSILLSLTIIIGWITESKDILTFFSDDATMKFNTALVFLFSGINLFLIDKKEAVFITLYKILTLIIVLIGAITLYEYFGYSLFNIDNLFINDSISKMNPGRMSPATAICSILIGVSFSGFKFDNNFYIKLSKSSKLLVTAISFISIISYILIIPSENRSLIFKTMSFDTSILFFIISLVLMFKRENSVFNSLFFSKYMGSEIFRKTLPLIILIPAVFANAILLAIKQNWINIDFGLVIFAVIIIPICILFISNLAFKLNSIDKERQNLEDDLILKNKKLTIFNDGLKNSVVFCLTGKDGIIKYVNNSFCEISKFSREELVGSSHALLNSGYHDDDFFKNLWKTINSGKIWTGEIKNKSKEGSIYTVSTTIIPVKDSNGNITDFLEINN
jgi:PAS domain S-box-containing protein